MKQNRSQNGQKNNFSSFWPNQQWWGNWWVKGTQVPQNHRWSFDRVALLSDVLIGVLITCQRINHLLTERSITTTSECIHGNLMSRCLSVTLVALCVKKAPFQLLSLQQRCSGGAHSQQCKELLFHFLEIRWWWEQELLLQTHCSLLFPSKRESKEVLRQA